MLRFMTTRRLLFIGISAMIAAGSFALALSLLGDQEKVSVSKKSTSSEEPLAVGFEGELIFGSLEEMLTASDLVVAGTVKEVKPGRVTIIKHEATPSRPEGTNAADDPQEATQVSTDDLVEEVRDLNTVVRVDNVLKGASADNSITVTTLEDAYGGDYQSLDWRKPDKRVLLFLSRSTETPGLYIPTKASYEQAVYVLQGGNIVSPTDSDELVTDQVTGLSLPELIAAVRDARTETPGG